MNKTISSLTVIAAAMALSNCAPQNNLQRDAAIGAVGGAVAGGIIIFIIALEMILGINLMKSDEEINSASVFPLAFPLIAGAGTLTTILSIKAEYHVLNIVIGIIINLIIVYIVIRSSGWIQRKIGKNGEEILRKVFGIILLAISIKLIQSNLSILSQG